MSTKYDPYSNAAEFWEKSKMASKASSDAKYLKQNRPHIFIEKPALYSMLPNLKGKKILALGCGSGEELDLYIRKGASDITGIDISSALIDIARANYPGHEFFVSSADDLSVLGENTYDYVFSSLMMNYFSNWEKVLSEIFDVIKPGGEFIFSTVHPVKWSAQKINDEDGKAYATYMGFEKDPETHEERIYGNYLNNVELNETWGKELTVRFYSRSISNIFRDLTYAGFSVEDIFEPKAIEETREYDKFYWEVNQRIPNFIFFKCKKPQ